jgi:hypothetical protein
MVTTSKDPTTGCVVKTVEQWEELEQFQVRDWAYRGQSVLKNPLSSSLERLWLRENVGADRRLTLEAELVRAFRRAYHQYAADVPKTNAELEWHSIMRHHGAPSRLLDFTFSLYIAAYFA